MLIERRRSVVEDRTMPRCVVYVRLTSVKVRRHQESAFTVDFRNKTDDGMIIFIAGSSRK